MNLELIRLYCKRYFAEKIKETEHLAEGKKFDDVHTNIRRKELAFLDEIEELYASEIKDFFEHEGVVFHHREHGLCRIVVYCSKGGQYSETMTIDIAPCNYNLDKVPQEYKKTCVSWNKTYNGDGDDEDEEDSFGVYGFPSPLSPVLIEVNFNMGEPVDYEELFLKIIRGCRAGGYYITFEY